MNQSGFTPHLSRDKKKNTYLAPLKKGAGFIALITILIISAIILLMLISTSLANLDQLKMVLQKNQASESFYLATACAEEALIKLKDDLNYTGNETLIFDGGTCTILPVEGTNNSNRVIKTSGSAGNQVQKIKIEINKVNPEIEISSWQEGY